jgi:hypothetical protein
MDARTFQSSLVRVINRIGARWGPGVRLDPPYLMDRARQAAGLEDFGDSGFEKALGVLVDSYEREARFHLVGRMLAQRNLVGCLIHRLRIEEYFRRNPETANVPVPDPVIITGAPRSGTTLLHRLLAADSSNRTLRTWKLFAPVPRGLAPPGEDDPRSAAVARGMAVRRALLLSAAGRKASAAVHRFEAGDPEECWPLLQNSLFSEIFGMFTRADSYMLWLRTQDWTPPFRYHRKQIQMLTAGRPASRLVLKHPGYLGYLDDLFRVYPKARVVWLHRDPIEVVASTCSLCAVARAGRTDFLDREQLGAAVVESTLSRFARGMRMREQLGAGQFLPGQFMDVRYRDFVRNPMETVARIYEWLGIPVTVEAEQAFTGYLQRNRQERRSHRHDYTLETFGLDAALLRPKFRDYCERFQIDSASAE